MKTHSTFTVDVEVMEKARSADINCSEAAEDGIRRALFSRGIEMESVEGIKHERELTKKKQEEKQARSEREIQACYARGDFSAAIPNGSVFNVRRLF